MSFKERQREASIVALFSKPRFGAIDDDGSFTEFVGRPEDWLSHPLVGRARWVGGTQDGAVVLAAFKALSE